MNDVRARRASTANENVAWEAVVAAIQDLGPQTRLYTLESADGLPFSSFRAGSFLPLILEAAGTTHAWPYALSSSPREAEQGIYRIVVKRDAGGFASKRISDTWKVGDRITVGTPVEDDAHSRLNEGDELIAIVGSIGVVPFHSIAQAIADGDADFRLTVFYAANTRDELLFRAEWPKLVAQSSGRLQIVPVLACEHVEGCEHGRVTRALIERHAETKHAIFLLRGPASLVASMRMELAPWKLSRRRFRSAFTGEGEAKPANLSSAIHQVTIRMGGTTRTIPAREDHTVLDALELAGLQPPADCRTGVCGYCHATLLSGEFILATDEAAERRMHDRSSPFHPCCSYPISDMELVLRPSGKA